MYNYEDYYREPNEFEEQIEDFKNSLYDCVKQEHKDKMERLEKENKELQEIKQNFEKLETEYKYKIRELDTKIESAERDAKKLRLNEVMEELKQELWQANKFSVYDKKCDKCDDNREIKFKSPSGKEMKETCECGTSLTKYKPVSYEIYSFQQNKSSISKWYKRRYRDEERWTEDNKCLEFMVCSEEDFKNIPNNYNTFFATEELCVKYCDMKNKENGITSDVTEERNNNPKRRKDS